MAVNKVNFGGNTLIDLTGDTLESAEQLMKGIIAHAKDGSVITGLMEAGGGGYDFGGTAIEIVSGSFTVPERTICNSLFPLTSPLELPFQNLPSGYKQRGRFFILWDATKDSSNNGSSADIISASEENDIFAVMNFYVSHVGTDRSNGAYIYRSSTYVSSGYGYWFGEYDGIYTTDSKKYFGAGKTYKWVAWATKAVWDA